MGMGLRERKKEQTRRLIAETAWRLFSERGFDRVTVAEVAREAQVAEATVFNYFPTKEDLFYSGLDVFGTRLLDAVHSRDPGEPALRAFQRHALDVGGMLTDIQNGDTAALQRATTMHRVIAESPALQAREQHIFARHAAALAGLIAAETGAPPDDVTPHVVANALTGVHRALIDLVRRRILAGDRPETLARDVVESGTNAFACLEQGLQDYAPKPTDEHP